MQSLLWCNVVNSGAILHNGTMLHTDVMFNSDAILHFDKIQCSGEALCCNAEIWGSTLGQQSGIARTLVQNLGAQ